MHPHPKKSPDVTVVSRILIPTWFSLKALLYNALATLDLADRIHNSRLLIESPCGSEKSLEE